MFIIFFFFQSPKFAPPIEFVDQAALSPPEGYKDGGAGGDASLVGISASASANLQQALGGALGGHVFGAQHIQQLQVIQRLQAQRAAMMAARASANQGQIINQPVNVQHSAATAATAASTVCAECAECAECAAKLNHEDGKYIFLHMFGFWVKFQETSFLFQKSWLYDKAKKNNIKLS